MYCGTPGDCLLIETNQEAGHIKSHLFVIIIDFEEHTHNTIIVNVQSVKNGKFDNTVVLKKGDHPFIKWDSFVNYSLAQIISRDELEYKLARGLASMQPPLNEEIFIKIREGICKSRFTPIEIIEMYNNGLYAGLF